MFAGTGPRMVNGRVLVPLRGIFEQMGANVRWNEAMQKVSADRGSTTIELRIGDHYANVNGRSVELDQPATMIGGRTMVPLRFISESFGANVDWTESTQTVAIITNGSSMSTTNSNTSNTERSASFRKISFTEGTVIPVKLRDGINSSTARKGDRFTASVINDAGEDGYQGLPAGTVVLGHVDTVKAMSKESPGVIGLTFDRLRFPDGSTHRITGSLIGLDEKSVSTDRRRIVARQNAKSGLKYVGVGAGAGALLAVVTKQNVLTTAAIGAALGYLYDELQRDKSKMRDVDLAPGTEFGIRLDQDMAVPVPTSTF